MNREAAEANWRTRFDEFGLSQDFDFIGRDWTSDKGRKAWVRCKSCGKEFLTWGVSEVFRGRQDHLLCIECGSSSGDKVVWNRSRKCDNAMAYYQQGHTVAETAEHFGVTESQINNAAKVRGVTNGRRFGEPSDRYKESVRQNAERDMAIQLNALGYDYVGGYVNTDSHIFIRCHTCGTTFSRAVQCIKKKKVTCFECQKIETRKRQEVNRKARAEQSEIKRIEDQWHRLMYPPKDKRKEELLNKTGICEICGKSYTVREYVRSCGMKYARDNGVCSKECRKEKLRQILRESHKGRQDSHRHRAVKFGCEYDPSVTLKKLVKRDGLRCAICGEMCDWNDHSWSEYSGPLYPSIDHIIPMSKGGGHTWDNVQVAHIICNSYKSDHLEEVI